MFISKVEPIPLLNLQVPRLDFTPNKLGPIPMIPRATKEKTIQTKMMTISQGLICISKIRKISIVGSILISNRLHIAQPVMEGNTNTIPTTVLSGSSC